MNNAWPSGVPASLWTYSQLRPEALEKVPMMGVKFAPGFIYAFAFGCFFVAFFAWNRFSRASEDKSTTKALAQVSAADLGGHAALMRAYFIYAGAILLLYVTLTFFGELIVQSAQMIPVVGIQVESADLKFNSPQWPLMLAFAFAGLAPMLKPFGIVENWLRNRAYRAVGIPVRLEQTMRSLIATFEHACAAFWQPDESSEKPDSQSKPLQPLSKRLERYHDDWIGIINKSLYRATHFENHRLARKRDLLSLLAQLEVLIFWARTARGGWPGHEVTANVRNLELATVERGEDLMNRLRRMLLEPLPTGDETDKARRLAQVETDLVHFITEIRATRDDMVSILAIFLERDMDSPDTKPANNHPVGPNESLVALLRNTERPDTPGTGPETGLFFALIAVFLIYCAATWQGLQLPVGQYLKPSDIQGMVLTALVETLRIASLTWLPLLAAFSLRQYLWDRGDWARARNTLRPSGYGAQIITCLCLGLAVSLLGLAGVAVLRAFLIAPTPERFHFLLFDARAPFLLYYPTQAVVLLVLIPISVVSADQNKSNAVRLWLGILCGIGVMLLSMQHLQLWNPTLADSCGGLKVIASLDCARRFDLLGHVILGVMSFLAAGVFGELPDRLRRTARSHRASMAAALLLILLPLDWGLAQGVPDVTPPADQGSETTTEPGDEPKTVTIGFRADAPPFSVGQSGSPGTPYKGYLADLCYDIFDGSTKYTVKSAEITAENRFDRLRPREPAMEASDRQVDAAASTGGGSETEPSDQASESSPADYVDIVCDAVTMRFSDLERAESAIFSPIVFASGVSVLERGDGPGIVIGYVRNTTAKDVARKTCQVDYFQALLPTQKEHLLLERCNLRWHAALLLERLELMGWVKDDSSDGAQSGSDAAGQSGTGEETQPDTDEAQSGSDAAGQSGTGEETQPDGNEAMQASADGAEPTEAHKERLQENIKRLRKNIRDFMKAGDVLNRIASADTTLEGRLDEHTVKLRDLANPDAPSLADCLNKLDSDTCGKLVAKLHDPVCPPERRKVEKPDASVAIADQPWPDYHFCPARSHDDLIEWLCTTQERRLIYMGDRELIQGKHESWTPARGSCVVKRRDSAEYLSYEPYAFPISMNNPELVQFVQQRIHQLFSDRTRMDARFRTNFPRGQMSVPLAYLFLLNAVEYHDRFATSSPAEANRTDE